MGDVTLVLENNCHLELKHCLYTLESRKNLVSISSINNVIIQFTSIKVFLLERRIHLFAQTCWLTPISILPCVENYQISLKKKVPNTNQAYLQHLCLGHINLNKIQRLIKSGILHSLVPKDLLICESCIEGKMSKMPFIAKGIRAK